MRWAPPSQQCPMLRYSVVSDSLWLWTLPGSQGFSRQGTGVDCHGLLQGIFPTQGRNLSPLGVLHCQAGSLPLAHLGSRAHYISQHRPWRRSGGSTGLVPTEMKNGNGMWSGLYGSHWGFWLLSIRSCEGRSTKTWPSNCLWSVEWER